MNINLDTNWHELWMKNRAHFKATIYDNVFIPENPFLNQIKFLIYPSEELLYGGAAGGGKSSAILMSALQYVEEKNIPEGENKLNYNALIIRKTFEDLDMPNAIMSRAKQWLLPFEDDGLVTWKEQKKRFIFNSGATLTFRYLNHDKHLNSYQGSELQFVAFDELTQFPEHHYKYLHSRLRKLENSNIGLRIRSTSNPGGVGHDWVKSRFVSNDSPLPFIPSSYTDNKYLNQEEYSNQLDKLDELTKQQLKHGDWDAAFTKGLLMNLDRLNKNLINVDESYKPVFSTIGIDPAGSGSDKFSVSLLTYFTNNKFVLMDLLATPDNNFIEEDVKNFVMRNLKWNPVLVNFEREPGSRSEDALKYWQMILSEYFNSSQIIDTAASSTGSKYNRARPHANAIKENKLYFNQTLLSNTVGNYNPLNSLFNQYVYIHPDKTVMKNYSSPDELDSLSYAWIAMEQLLNNQSHVSTARIGG